MTLPRGREGSGWRHTSSPDEQRQENGKACQGHLAHAADQSSRRPSCEAAGSSPPPAPPPEVRAVSPGDRVVAPDVLAVLDHTRPPVRPTDYQRPRAEHHVGAPQPHGHGTLTVGAAQEPQAHPRTPGRASGRRYSPTMGPAPTTTMTTSCSRAAPARRSTAGTCSAGSRRPARRRRSPAVSGSTSCATPRGPEPPSWACPRSRSPRCLGTLRRLQASGTSTWQEGRAASAPIRWRHERSAPNRRHASPGTSPRPAAPLPARTRPYPGTGRRPRPGRGRESLRPHAASIA